MPPYFVIKHRYEPVLHMPTVTLAAEPGFEPGQKDSKSFVLPLHNSATIPAFHGAEGRGRTDTRVAPQQFLRLSRLPIPPLRLECQSYFQCATHGAEAQDRTGDTRIFSPLLYLAELPRHDTLLYLFVDLSVNIA